MGVSINADFGNKVVLPQVMSELVIIGRVFPMLAQHFSEIVFGLDPMEINGLLDITIDPL